MLTLLQQFFTLPRLADDTQQRRARVLYSFLLNIEGALLIALVIGVPFVFVAKTPSAILLVAGMIISAIAFTILKTGKVSAASIFMLVMLWLVTTLLVFISGGLRSYYILFYLSSVPIAGILFNARGAMRYAALNLATSLVIAVMGGVGFDFPLIISAFPVGSILIILFVNVAFVLLPLNINLQEMAQAVERARQQVQERQLTEKALRESQALLAEKEERYRLISTVTSDYMFSSRLEAEGQQLQLNWVAGAFEAITGYTYEEYVASGGWVTKVHPDDREKDAADIATLQTNKPVISEIRTLHKNGEVHWVRIYAHPLWEAERNLLIGIYGAVQDVTRQKEAEVEREQHAQEIFILYKLGLAIATGHDLYQTLYNLLEEIQRLFLMDSFYVGIYDAEQGLLNFPLFFDEGQIQPAPPRDLRAAKGLAGAVIFGGKTLYLPDLQDPETQKNYEILSVNRSAPTSRTFLGVPLVVQGRVFGIISVQSEQPYLYTPHQVNLFETIAVQASVFIERALLIDQLQRELLVRTQAEMQVQESLKEKELLLKEVHHRVKNNMQVIVSLLNLQSTYVTDEALLNALRESQNRVRSMALVHEKLYQSTNLAQIDFREYLNQLTATLFNSYSSSLGNVDLKIDVGEVAVGVEAAIPCGLIVNELVSNSLKHAFPYNRAGQIRLSLQPTAEGLFELSVSDDGVGIPEEKDWRQTESLGMQLVQSLTHQINGTVELKRLTPGTRFTIRFPA